MRGAGQWLRRALGRKHLLLHPCSQPPPNCHCLAASKLGDKVFFFGGYGGGGADLGDLWVLHLGGGGLRWEEVSASGPAPPPRFDHTATLVATAANSPSPDKLLILGGRDSTQNFTDAHVLDLESMAWEQAHGMPALGGEVGVQWGVAGACWLAMALQPVLMRQQTCKLCCRCGRKS